MTLHHLPRLALGIACTFTSLAFGAAQDSQPPASSCTAPAHQHETASPFTLDAVRLLDGPFKHAQDVNRDYLLRLDIDRLLAPFLIEAGLPPKAPKYPNWESCGLDGHTAGHYLTAIAQMWPPPATPR